MNRLPLSQDYDYSSLRANRSHLEDSVGKSSYSVQIWPSEKRSMTRGSELSYDAALFHSSCTRTLRLAAVSGFQDTVCQDSHDGQIKEINILPSHRNASGLISYAKTNATPIGTNSQARIRPTLHGPQASPAQSARYCRGLGAHSAVALSALNKSLRKMTGARRMDGWTLQYAVM